MRQIRARKKTSKYRRASLTEMVPSCPCSSMRSEITGQRAVANELETGGCKPLRPAVTLKRASLNTKPACSKRGSEREGSGRRPQRPRGLGVGLVGLRQRPQLCRALPLRRLRPLWAAKLSRGPPEVQPAQPNRCSLRHERHCSVNIQSFHLHARSRARVPPGHTRKQAWSSHAPSVFEYLSSSVPGFF